MAFGPLNLTDIQSSNRIVDEEGRPSKDFVRLINQNNKNSKQTVAEIEAALDAAIAAQADADAAQDAAIAALADAAAAQSDATAAQGAATDAQTTADAALLLAGTAVQQNVGPSWVAATGTTSRATFATYSAPVISNPPTQAEAQAVADAVQIISQRMAALIDDLTGNGALSL